MPPAAELFFLWPDARGSDQPGPRTLSRARAARPRRHGRGLPGARHQARARRRHQSARARKSGRRRRPPPSPARGARALARESPFHRHGSRLRHRRRHRLRRHGAHRRRAAGGADRARGRARGRGDRLRARDRRRARGGARRRHHPPRPEAGQRPHHSRQPREGDRLRPGAPVPGDGRARRDAVDHRHAGVPRHGALHAARTAPGGDGRRRAATSTRSASSSTRC